MDSNNQNMHAPMNGDDALAKALNGGLSFEETPAPGAPTTPANSNDDMSFSDVTTKADEPAAPPTLEPATADEPSSSTPVDSDLESIKTSAINDLRPLLDKLKLPDEEKFDTLLLFIRSTDDTSLLKETYEAAKAIEDEDKRAKALLDVIREVSYFSSKK